MTEPPPAAPRILFPRWSNYLLPGGLLLVLIGGLCLPLLVGLTASPQATSVGYAPQQPIPFSHQVHVGQLKMDCRYCHSTVDQQGFAAIPSADTCMGCHATLRSDSPLLEPLREAHSTGEPIRWKKVHDLADYVYFDHAAHVNQGVGCYTCHGAVDQMKTLFQSKPMSMAWCIECHRQPEKFLRPREQVTNMNWDPVASTGKTQLELGRELKQQYQIQGSQYMTSCSMCHR